ncbi:hypothetical protein BDK51DRAFT_35153 [Blyttiomyces helicus]|uniref:Uncharacterized protein n=1 Tax=Blyttiomyces helicus TaxID=388810 RepID=A0A4V1IPS6_9FUNG|nr:hypothetical protein BDK51DRAFT_35153 [Blyttiomyces helicus]|eukprot:RKO84087.1 hypothetical protein BDK51DRAFT_35153 [Blyttiomyces helicus]
MTTTILSVKRNLDDFAKRLEEQKAILDRYQETMLRNNAVITHVKKGINADMAQTGIWALDAELASGAQEVEDQFTKSWKKTEEPRKLIMHKRVRDLRESLAKGRPKVSAMSINLQLLRDATKQKPGERARAEHSVGAIVAKLEAVRPGGWRAPHNGAEVEGLGKMQIARMTSELSELTTTCEWKIW